MVFRLDRLNIYNSTNNRVYKPTNITGRSQLERLVNEYASKPIITIFEGNRHPFPHENRILGTFRIPSGKLI